MGAQKTIQKNVILVMNYIYDLIHTIMILSIKAKRNIP